MIGRTNVKKKSGGSLRTATINVTTPLTELFGMEVTCTDGVSIFTSTFSDTGECSFVVNDIGIYTITCDDNAVSVDITELGLTYPVTLDITQLVNYLILYNEGDECEEVTGGWTGYTKTSGDIAKKGENYLRVYNPAYDSNTEKAKYIPFFKSEKAIDITGYTMALMMSELVSNSHWARCTFAPQSVTELPYMHREVLTFTDYLDMNYATTPTDQIILINDTIDDPGEFYAYFMAGNQNTGSKSDGYLYNLALFKEDNWQKWISKAGLSADTYTTLDSVLSDAAAMATLMNSFPAVNYMILQCTGTVLAGVIQSETALDAIANSKYYNNIYGNIYWKKILDMSGFVPRTYLYNEGEENVTFVELNWEGNYAYQRASNTKNESNLHTEIIASSSYEETVFAGWQTANIVDMSLYSKVLATVKSSGSSTNNYIGLSSIDLSENEVSGSSIAGLQFSDSDYQDIELDVSEITDQVYLFIRLYTNSNSGYGTLEIKRIWLE